jgi:hypothetical protein
VSEQSYQAPIPKVFYIHDDLSDVVRQRYGPSSQAFMMTLRLFELLRLDAERVVILHLQDQIEALLSSAHHAPFAVTIGIGQAGERVTHQLHARTGWFPHMRRVDVTREEDGRGGYNLVGLHAMDWREPLNGLEEAGSIAIVDDTIFSGFTMSTILHALPQSVRGRTHAFCLRGIAESVSRIEHLCPVSIGFSAPGRMLDEISFINASGLVLRVGIRRPNQVPMAFFERPMWMQAWFPDHAEDVIEACRQLNAVLDSATRV